MIGVSELIEAAEGLPRIAGRSALYRWMMLNREEFERQLVGGRPDWSALATAFGRFGLLDRNRHLPTGQTRPDDLVARQAGRGEDAWCRCIGGGRAVDRDAAGALGRSAHHAAREGSS